MAIGKFNKNFTKNNIPDFRTIMLIEEANCSRDSHNSKQHSDNYDLTLVAALMYVERVNFVKYLKVLK